MRSVNLSNLNCDQKRTSHLWGCHVHFNSVHDLIHSSHVAMSEVRVDANHMSPPDMKTLAMMASNRLETI